MYAKDPNATKINFYSNLSSIQMQYALSSGPVVAAIYSNDNFQTYSSGIFSGCSTFDDSYSKLNHAVVIIGYDSNGNYIIKNSWGTAWG